LIQEIRGKGLMLAAMTKSADITNEVILNVKTKDSYYFGCYSREPIRITPPLTISEEEIEKVVHNARSNG
jgi:acetylornithine/succinyldiaminopimelate/putrescine aminotransferase